MVPVWGLLVKDTIDSVKIKAIEATDILVQKVIKYIIIKLTKSEIAENFIGHLKNIDP